MYRSILVPLDGSPAGEHALPLAVSIARRAPAAIHLVHVHVAAGSLGVDVAPRRDDTEQRARELAYLDELAQNVSGAGAVAVSTTVLDAPIAHALHSYAMAHGVDLMVMTTHGRGALSRRWMGSVADRLMRQSVAPVLLVRPQDTPPDLGVEPILKHLLIPLDGSALAEQILPHACALGRLMQAELTLIQAAELALASTELYGSEFDSSVQERVQAQAQRYLDGVAAGMRSEGLNVQTKVVLGWPAQHILEYAHSHKIDAIALAAHGRGGVARLLLGSVSDKVVRGATAPVLLCRPHEG